MFALSFFTVCLSATAAFAAPSKLSHCNVSKDTLAMPSTATNGASPLATPMTGGPKFIGIGVGVQNYTCSSAGTYTSTGALADIFDISCLPSSTYKTVTDIAFDAWKATKGDISASQLISSIAAFKPAFVLGQHYFIVNPLTGSGLSPKWDFTSASEAGHADAFMVGAKTGDVPAPTSPATNVDWLSLSGVQGDLAQQVFRMETRGGQPPASCAPGSQDISVNYVAQYWFYGGSF